MPKNKRLNVTNHPNNKNPMIRKPPDLQNVKSYKMFKVTKCQNLQNVKVTKCPKLQSVQSYKMSKVTKCPKLQNVQSYKMFKVTKCSKLQNVQNYKLFLSIKCLVQRNYGLNQRIIHIQSQVWRYSHTTRVQANGWKQEIQVDLKGFKGSVDVVCRLACPIHWNVSPLCPWHWIKCWGFKVPVRAGAGRCILHLEAVWEVHNGASYRFHFLMIP